MAESFNQSGDWSPVELDAIISDYFEMWDDELARRPYVKSRHRAALMGITGRSAASVEFKHRNISAVLQELGLPWIWGYKPAMNYQEALFEAVDRYLSGHREVLEPQPSLARRDITMLDEIFVTAPNRSPAARRPGLDRLIRKFDPVERDFRNRQLGRDGEEFVFGLERRRLIARDRGDLASRVRWVAQEDGDGAGFDILSFDDQGGERLIEVKTTAGAARTPFFLTRNELAVAQERGHSWHLYRVHLFAQSPKIYTVRPPLDEALRLEPETWRASPSDRTPEPAAAASDHHATGGV